MGMLLGSLALNTIPVATANDRERGILRRFKATPMPSWQWIAAQIGAYFVIGLLGAILLTAVGKVAFDIQLPGNWALVFVGFTLSAISFMAFGYLVASLAPNARAASVVGQLLFMPMMFVSGVAMPRSLLPAGIQAVSEWLPMTHIVILMQDLWFGRGWPLLSVCVLLGILVVGGALSAWLFRWE
jgi:ABC-2 type transport system permease protein